MSLRNKIKEILEEVYLSEAMNYQIKKVVDKFGISKPDKTLNFPGKQTSILDA